MADRGMIRRDPSWGSPMRGATQHTYYVSGAKEKGVAPLLPIFTYGEIDLPRPSLSPPRFKVQLTERTEMYQKPQFYNSYGILIEFLQTISYKSYSCFLKTVRKRHPFTPNTNLKANKPI